MNIRGFLKGRWFGRGVIILWLISSVFVWVLLIKIDGIVHGTLYGYGLRFDYEWAEPYWLLLKFAFVGLAFPMVLGGIVLFSSFLRTDNAETEISERNVTIALSSARTSDRARLISCSSCKKVFSSPLVLLDFSKGKERFVNVCPYCNAVLRSTKQKDKSAEVLVDLKREAVNEEEQNH